MSLDAAKLEQVRELPGGRMQARCPACAEGGHDRRGEHLLIYPDGRFGCCVHPKEGEHRKRIFALVGVHKPGTFTLRIKTPPALPVVRSVKAALTAFAAGTLGTAKSESVSAETSHASDANLADTEFGTFGTPKVKLRACARVESTTMNRERTYSIGELKDSETAVLNVPRAGGRLPPLVGGEGQPFLTADGSLAIPFDSPERYCWWKPDGERLSVAQTLQEVKERMKHAVTV